MLVADEYVIGFGPKFVGGNIGCHEVETLARVIY
jgi:hypothetical protein